MLDDTPSAAPTSDPFEPAMAPAPGASRAALIALFAIVVATQVLHTLDWQSIPSTLATVVVVLAVSFAAAMWALRDALDGHRRRVAALAMLGFVPLLAVEARRALGEPLPSGSQAEAALAAVALGLPSFTAVGALAWRAAARPSAELRRSVRGIALSAIAVCVALVAVGGLLFPHDRMPRIAELAPLPSGDDGFWEERADGAADAPFALGRSCIGASCFAYVRSGGATRSIGPRFARDARVTLLAPDDEHLVLSANGQAIAVAPIVLDDTTLGDRPGAAFAARTGLPSSFLALAALGLAMAVLGLLYRRRLGGKLAALAAAEQAWVLDNGWLTLESGACHRSLPGMAPGPLLLERPPQSQPYRGAGQDDAPRTHAGTRHDLVAELQGTRSSIDVLVVGWLIPLTTPLLVALVFAYWG